MPGRAGGTAVIMAVTVVKPGWQHDGGRGRTPQSSSLSTTTTQAARGRGGGDGATCSAAGTREEMLEFLYKLTRNNMAALLVNHCERDR